jgi:hypothetical protein
VRSLDFNCKQWTHSTPFRYNSEFSEHRSEDEKVPKGGSRMQNPHESYIKKAQNSLECLLNRKTPIESRETIIEMMPSTAHGKDATSILMENPTE